MNRTSQWLTSLVLTFGVMTTALAVNLPTYYPSSFQATGTIDAVSTNPNRRTIIIGDSGFAMSPDVIVHTPIVRSGGATLLRAGLSIGFSISGASATSKGFVSEVWVFPAGYVVPR